MSWIQIKCPNSGWRTKNENYWAKKIMVSTIVFSFIWSNMLKCTKRTKNKSRIDQWRLLFSSKIGTIAIAISPIIWKQNQYRGIQGPGIQDGSYLVSFGMVGLFSFGMPFKIQTIQHLNYFHPFKIQACLVFEPPLYKFKRVGKHFELFNHTVCLGTLFSTKNF